MSFFSELRRRNVFRVAIAYAVVAWLIAQVAELALDSFGSPEWVMKTILLVLVLGLPFAIVFAWAFELTPEGVKRERDVDRTQSITGQTGRKLNYTIIGVLVVALVLALATRGVEFGSREASEVPVTTGDGEQSIAVLPFVNMSDDPDNEYFSDGISEELLNVLVKIEGLRVASRTSSFSFKGKDTSIPDIANALNVEHVLEGSVRKAGDTVRITAQLIDVRTDSHLWSETYDRKLEDVFVIQDEISAHIVDALRVALGAGEITQTASQPTENLGAYQDYLKARHFWQRRGEENIRKAIELFTKAVEADPGFARAWSGLGAAHLTMPTYSREPSEAHHRLALEYAQKSLLLDPTIAESHSTIGDLLRYERRWDEAEAHYLDAIQLEPKTATGYLWYAEHLVATGRLDAALTNALMALELDPFNAGANSMAAVAYLINGDIESTMRLGQSAWDLGHPAGAYWAIDSQRLLGNYSEALKLIEENADFLGEGETIGYTMFIEALQDPTRIDAYLEYVATFDNAGGVWLAFDEVSLGRIDKGINDAIEANLNGSEMMRIWEPEFLALRQHPRFAELLENAGLVTFWDEIGWPSQCSRNGEHIACD